MAFLEKRITLIGVVSLYEVVRYGAALGEGLGLEYTLIDAPLAEILGAVLVALRETRVDLNEHVAEDWQGGQVADLLAKVAVLGCEYLLKSADRWHD